ncbi:molybdenum cofactor guanylyltransferase [Sphingomonas psychrotolerans]|uniref:Molybdenum cofactor guanylyltransferase n=1 Tax=Sphingomonas psychrotolerans TaxID=1327635 RepID=A0ABU3N4E4_9SPHN|nr:molybdenum cofactor guanylyltransferase [Sphingomonas psychrotolerans]MDT8758739.1 molybdenum cofactor guanylyltransferase [Sphingomonas psychrotolerans]
MKLLGAILAGGRARRFGSDKAEATLNGRTLLAHVADALRPHCDALVLCGRTHPDWTSLEDRPRAGLGPLGGLCAALAYGEAAGFTAVLSAPCDTPNLPPDLLDRLSEASPTYVIDLPVVGLWPCTLAEQLGCWLDQAENRSIRAWARSVSATPVDFGHKLGNINTRDDLIAFEAPRASRS